jgi:urease accessory protein
MTTTTRIEVAAGPGGPRVAVSPGVLRARRLSGPGPAVRLGLVATEALLLAGDEVRVEVCVDGAVAVEVVEIAGTVAYDMRGGSARWDVALELSGGAELRWVAQPFVVAGGADVDRTTTLTAEEGCTAMLRETLVLGRAGETGGSLRSGTDIAVGGNPLLVEHLDLGAGARAGWATLHGHRCLDTLTAVGLRLPDDPGTLQLEGCGSVVRWIGDELHLSPVG